MIYTCAILLVILGLSIYVNIRLGTTILKMEDTIEECLDVIDDKYNSMSEILKRPLFYDSPEVKVVVEDIKIVRESLHAVALSLTENIIEEEGEE